MKELSIEEKAKRYDEALEKSKILYEQGTITESLCYVFPELKENEDEKIRRNIIAALKGEGYYDSDLTNECIAWLEKQGKLPIPKLRDINEVVEPKFHEGDWVVSGRFVTQIREIAGDGYVNSHNGFISFEGAKYYHLWTIQDARDGDVLATIKGGVFIYAKVLYNKPYAYCGVDKFGVFKDNCLNNNWTNSVDNIHPATKEQHDLLFSKMKEAGYEWDAEKKELRVEQKSADKVKPKFKIGDWCIDNEDGTIFQIVKVLDNTYIYKTNEGKEYSCTHYSLENDARLWTIQDAKDGDVLYSECLRILWIFKGRGTVYCGCNLNYNDGAFCGEGYIETPTDVIPATKEQRDFLFEKMKEAGYEWDAEHKQLNKIEQKFAEWSEENEHTLQGIIDEIQANKNQAPDYDLATYDRFLSWLKSLKQRNTWKPSDAQMASITCAVRKMKESACYDSELVSLLNDLKKLTE